MVGSNCLFYLPTWGEEDIYMYVPPTFATWGLPSWSLSYLSV